MSDATTGKAKKTLPALLSEFDEVTYLRLNPDLLVAVAEGRLAVAHYPGPASFNVAGSINQTIGAQLALEL